jgi:hypothetical protein
MASITPFEFDGNEIRFVNDKPVANDVAKALGYKDPADAVYRIVKPKNKGVGKIQTPGGKQSITVLEEPGIYQLIFGSKLESAERFQDWVFEVVLPSIRKTGSYGVDEPFFWVRLKIYIRQNAPNVPDGYFTIFRECLDLVSDLEAIGYILPANAIPDISVGKCWANYLKAENIPHDSVPYNHTYPDDVRGDKACRAYSETLLPLFRQWFRSTYKPVKLPDYIERRHREILPGVVKLLGLNPSSVKKALKGPIDVSQLSLF